MAPFFAPAVQPIELFFFKRVFRKLHKRHAGTIGCGLAYVDPTSGSLSPRSAREKEEGAPLLALPKKGQDEEDAASSAPSARTGVTRSKGSSAIDDDEETEVNLVDLQRAIVRLFRVLQDPGEFNAHDYDINDDGKVRWLEFLMMWKGRPVCIKYSMAERIFLTFEDGSRSVLGKIISILVFLAILVSTGSFIISTLPDMQDTCPITGQAGFSTQCRPTPKRVFQDLDIICVVLFTFEYGLRLALSGFTRMEIIDRDLARLIEWMVYDEVIEPPGCVKRVLYFVFHWANLIDLAAIMPWYLQQLVPEGGDESTFIQMIRLTRVIRAFRLGRRLEAINIIMRTLTKSRRALRVLVLNMILFMMVFGALMYHAEQGYWNESTLAFERDDEWGDTSRSPFDSVPSSSWWAIVTATTVGYGDDYTPVTMWGKLVAGISMVWSLCVLALPIGVIGSNFSQVWDEYDKERGEERADRKREEALLRKAVTWGDPTHYSRRVVIEVWHGSGPGQRDPSKRTRQWGAEFLGEVDCILDFPSKEPVRSRRVQMPLCANETKARRHIRGYLIFEYSWQPQKIEDPSTLLQGRLDVTVKRAVDLVTIDWTGPLASPPYCVVVGYPAAPREDGSINEVAQVSESADCMVDPRWDMTMSFNIHWRQVSERVTSQRMTANRQTTRIFKDMPMEKPACDVAAFGDIEKLALVDFPDAAAGGGGAGEPAGGGTAPEAGWVPPEARRPSGPGRSQMDTREPDAAAGGASRLFLRTASEESEDSMPPSRIMGLFHTQGFETPPALLSPVNQSHNTSSGGMFSPRLPRLAVEELQENVANLRDSVTFLRQGVGTVRQDIADIVSALQRRGLSVGHGAPVQSSSAPPAPPGACFTKISAAALQ